MTHARRIRLALLITMLLAPSAAHAQDDPDSGGWVGSADGLVYVRAIDPGVTPGLAPADPSEGPASLDGLQLPDGLLEITSDRPDANGFHVVKILDRDTVRDPGPGRQPVGAIFGADDEGAAFARDQRNLVLPPACGDPAHDEGCLAQDRIDSIAGAFFGNAPPPSRPGDLDDGLLTSGVLADAGTLVALAGGADIETRVKARPGDETITIRAAAEIVPGFGGSFHGFRADVFELPPDSDGHAEFSADELGQAWSALADWVAGGGVKKNGTARQKVACPDSGSGLVASHYLFDRFGDGVADALDLGGLDGGTPLIVTELTLVRCGTPPSLPPFAALGCVDVSIEHSPLGDDPSHLEFDALLFTFGIPTADGIMADVRIGGMNGGKPLMLEVTPLDTELTFADGVSGVLADEATRGAQAWLVQGAGGIRSFGAKNVKSFEVSASGMEPIELRTDARDVLGKAIDVSSSEITMGDCPRGEDGGSLLADAWEAEVEVIFADGFESGDTSAWTSSVP